MANIILIFMCFFLASIEALSFPNHNCSKYFTYGIEANGSYIGVFTADKAGVQQLSFNAVFMFKGSEHQVSAMELYPSRNDAMRNIENGYLGQAFVRFRNFTSVLPTLYNFSFNGNDLCKSTIRNFKKPYYLVKTSNSISTSQSIRERKDNRPIMHPNFPRIDPKIRV